MPTKAPLYGAPPFPYKDNRILSVLFKTQPEVLRELVPEPLVPNPDNLIFVYIGILNVGDPPTFTYNEMGIGIPVSLSDTAGNYCPYMYLDKAIPIAGGRESYVNASAEQLPFQDSYFDAMMSNGMFNLVIDKTKALDEVFRGIKNLKSRVQEIGQP